MEKVVLLMRRKRAQEVILLNRMQIRTQHKKEWQVVKDDSLSILSKEFKAEFKGSLKHSSNKWNIKQTEFKQIRVEKKSPSL